MSPGQSILFTSHKGGSGSTFCVQNLAALYAQQSKRCLILNPANASQKMQNWRSEYDVCLLDLPLAELSQHTANPWAQLDSVILILPLEPLAYRTLPAALETLEARLKPQQFKGILLNQTRAAEPVQATLETYLRRELRPYLLPCRLAYSPLAQRAALEQKTVVDLEASPQAHTLTAALLRLSQQLDLCHVSK